MAAITPLPITPTTSSLSHTIPFLPLNPKPTSFSSRRSRSRSSSIRWRSGVDGARGSLSVRWKEDKSSDGALSRIENRQRIKSVSKQQGFGFEGGRIGVENGNRRGTRSNVSVGEEVVSTGGGDIGSGGEGFGGGNGGGRDDGESAGDEEEGSKQNRDSALAALAAAGRAVESLPEYLAKAVKDGKIPPVVLQRFMELEKSPIRNWLMQFAGFRERLLADDLFLTKVGIECGVGLFTKTAAEYERRRENFTKELDFVVADVIMALVADFMLVWLPAPTVSLAPALAKNAGAIAKFFANCPDNAFQVALRGTSYSTVQRLGAIGRNGAKLLVVGTSASLLGTAVTNGLIKLRQTVDGAAAGEAEDIPILATSLAYGVYMAVSSNLRYQILAGVVEQRVLEPLLGQRKLALSASSFVVRTGNTFLGSLLWVDYARWVGVQKNAE